MAVMGIVMVAAAICVTTMAWKVTEWVWLRPKKLERMLLRQQGIPGNSYRLLHGDVREAGFMEKEASSKPMPHFTHQLVPYVLPHLHHMSNIYGETFVTWVGPTPRANDEQIKEVLLRHEEFGRPKVNPLLRWLVTGLPSYEGHKWAKHRRMINPAFQQHKLKHMLEAFYQSCSQMIAKWETLVSKHGSEEMDVFPELKIFTSDAISRAAFGSSYQEGQRIFQLLEQQAKLFTQALQSVYIPGWRFMPTKLNRKMKKNHREIRASLKGLIEKGEELIVKSNPDDLLGILMESNYREMEENKNNSGVGLSMDEVIEECKLFYFAGQETTAVLLVWTMLLLANHPTWQQSARDEVLQTFGPDYYNKPDFEGLNRLKVVSMILHEVLRLYPPVVLLARTVHRETRLGDIRLPAGSQVSMSVLQLHHNRRIWGDDADEFKPERFSEGVSKATNYNKLCFLPFGWGPRICIGQNFTLIEAEMALVLILRRFTFRLSPSYTHSPHKVITLCPQLASNDSIVFGRIELIFLRSKASFYSFLAISETKYVSDY